MAKTSLVFLLTLACSSTSTTKIEQQCASPQGCDASTGSGGTGASGSGGTVASGGTGAGSGGTAGIGTGGAGGSGGSATDAGLTIGDVPIQRIQNGTILANSAVAVRGVFVTAAKQQASAAYSFYMQEPQGQTSDGLVYPSYSGVAAFVEPALIASLPLPTAGQCVDVSGTVAEFQGQTQIVVSSIAVTANCGIFPGPLSVSASSLSLADIATDADPVTPGDQAGAMAERYEGVLLKVQNVQAASAGATFSVVDWTNPAGPTLVVSEFYYATNPVVGEVFTSIIGVFGQFGNYRLQPRSAGDVLRN